MPRAERGGPDGMGCAPGSAVEIRCLEPFDDLDALAPLYRELHEHYVSVAPILGALPARTAAASWRRRRRRYAQWLRAPGSFVVVAARGDRLIAYAITSLVDGYDAWDSRERIAEIRDLVVERASRGHGVATSLLEAIERKLAELGVAEYRLNVVKANVDATTFYLRRGLVPVSMTMLARVGRHARGSR